MTDAGGVSGWAPGATTADGPTRGRCAGAARWLTGLAAAALAVSTAPLAAQETGPVELELRAEHGETAVYRYESTTRISPPPKMGGETTVTSVMRMSRTPEAVGGDTIRYRARIEDFQLDYQSADGQANRQMQSMVEEARRRAEGRELRFTVSRRGEILWMSLGGETADGAGQVQQSIRRLLTLSLPGGPVSVGESWARTDSLASSAFGLPVAGTVVRESRATLRDLERRGGGPIADLHVEATFRFVPDPAAGGLQVNLQGSAAENLRFDVDAGRLLSSSGAHDFSMDISAPGRETSLSIQGGGETTATLVEP